VRGLTTQCGVMGEAQRMACRSVPAEIRSQHATILCHDPIDVLNPLLTQPEGPEPESQLQKSPGTESGASWAVGDWLGLGVVRLPHARVLRSRPKHGRRCRIQSAHRPILF
jgi:hypothetical protein